MCSKKPALAQQAYVAFVQICKGNSDDAGTYAEDEKLVRQALKRLDDVEQAAAQPPAAQSTLADRLALAVCVAVLPGAKPCEAPCNACRVNSAAVAHELAAIFREGHGSSSTTVDFLDGLGCHTPGVGQTVREETW
jgi:hypothetical protein